MGAAVAEQRVLHGGQVVRKDGLPAAGALVWVVSGSAPTPEIAVVCDAEGYFRLALPPGRFAIHARAKDGIEGRVALTAGMEPVDIRIELDGAR